MHIILYLLLEFHDNQIKKLKFLKTNKRLI